MRLSYFVTIIAALETSQFYQLHWAHRHLLPKRFRTLLLSKGILKAAVYIGISLLLNQFSSALAWTYAIAHPFLGVFLHVRRCKANGINPVRVEPRAKYVQATADWVTQLIKAETAAKSD